MSLLNKDKHLYISNVGRGQDCEGKSKSPSKNQIEIERIDEYIGKIIEKK